jgi:hypothetical protein
VVLGRPESSAASAAEGQALVADLGGRGDGDLLDPLRGSSGLRSQQLTDALDDEVVGAGLGVDALLAGLAERGADAVDEDDLLEGTGHGWPHLGHGGTWCAGCHARPRYSVLSERCR